MRKIEIDNQSQNMEFQVQKLLDISLELQLAQPSVKLMEQYLGELLELPKVDRSER